MFCLFYKCIKDTESWTDPQYGHFLPFCERGVQQLNPSSFPILLYTGDIMATAIEHMNLLVQKPLGCGEQNMIHFAPSVYVLHYLDMSAQDDKDIRSRALHFMMEGKPTFA